MPTTLTFEALRTNRQQLSADSVDVETGIIRRCTVMKAGVPAIGKFVLLNSKGEITKDPKLSVKKLPVFTDAETLQTLLSAAKSAGGRVKSREDHDDSIGARAGFTESFVLDGDRVAGDVHLFEAYRNRAIVLEAAKDTPDEIGLSIDFEPTYELLEDRALMRVSKLIAVDIVDEGAVTPDGLLLSASVDSARKVELESETISNTEKLSVMAEPTLADLMSAVQQCTAGYAALAKQMGEHGAVLAKLSAPAAAPDADNDGMKAMAAKLDGITTQLSSVTGTVAQLKKERALLGFKGTDAERVKLSSSPAEDIEKFNSEKKSYLQLVEETATREKCSKSKAHSLVQKSEEGSAAYAMHLSSKGIIRTTA